MLDNIQDVFALIKTFGPLGIAVAFFMWRDWKREDTLTSRIQDLETRQQEIILPLVRETSEIIAQNTAVMSQNIRVMERLESVLNR